MPQKYTLKVEDTYIVQEDAGDGYIECPETYVVEESDFEDNAKVHYKPKSKSEIMSNHAVRIRKFQSQNDPRQSLAVIEPLNVSESTILESAKIIHSQRFEKSVSRYSDEKSVRYVASIPDAIAIFLATKGNNHIPTNLINATNQDGDSALIIAARHGDMEGVQQLIRLGARVEHTNNANQTAEYTAKRNGHFLIADLLREHAGQTFIMAAEDGNEELVRALITQGMNVNTKTRLHDAALPLAAKQGHQKIVAALLENDIQVDITDRHGNTPLILAVYQGHFKIVQDLVSKGADIGFKNANQQTAEELASERGHTEIVEYLQSITSLKNTSFLEIFSTGNPITIYNAIKTHQHNPSLINIKNAEGETPLIWAARNGHIDIVTLLLKINTDVTVKNDKNQHRAIDEASEQKHTTIVELLQNAELFQAITRADFAFVATYLKNHPNAIKCKDNDGKTPLIFAAYIGQYDILELILQMEGIDLDAEDNHGETALGWAAYKGHTTLVEALIKKGANLLHKNRFAQTAEDIAIIQNHLDVHMKVRKAILLQTINSKNLSLIEEVMDKYENDPDLLTLKNTDGETLFFWAARNGHTNIVERLRKTGIDLNSKNDAKQTAAYVAWQNGHQSLAETIQYANLLQLLQTNNIDGLKELVGDPILPRVINCKDSDGNTLLIKAAAGNQWAIFNILLEIDGIDVNAVGDKGNTALIWAAQQEHFSAVKALIDKEADVFHRNHALEAASYTTHNRSIFTLLRKAQFLQTIKSGNYSTVQYEIQEIQTFYPEIINTSDSKGETALIWATRNRRMDIVSLLIKNSADITLKNSNNQRAIDVAAEYEYTEIVSILLKAEFFNAVSNGDQAFVEVYLKDNPGAINFKDIKESPLIFTAINAEWSICEYLMQREDIDLEATDSQGNTPLIMAASIGHLKAVQYLVNKGVNLFHTNSYGTAEQNARDPEIIDFLRKNAFLQLVKAGNPISITDINNKTNCDLINASNRDEDTALILAARHGHLDIITALLEQDVNVWHKNNNQQTAIDEAERNGHVVILKLLQKKQFFSAVTRGDLAFVKSYLENNPQAIHDVDTKGNTLLILASMHGHRPLVQLLLEKGSSINTANLEGDTALMHAADIGSKDIVQILLHEDADPYLQNKKQQTAEDKALQKGHVELARFLFSIFEFSEVKIENTDFLYISDEQNNNPFCGDLSTLSFVEHLSGGSGGVYRLKDPQGKQYTFKASEELKHLQEEVMADALYQAAGCPVPKFALVKKIPACLAQFQLPQNSLYRLAEFIEKKEEYDPSLIKEKLAKHFLADVLLSNLDIAVGNFKNVILSKENCLYRIDNGGSLRYRAKNGLKMTNALWSPYHVEELHSLRNPGINSAAAAVYGDLSEADLLKQHQDLLSHANDMFKSLKELSKVLCVESIELEHFLAARFYDLELRLYSSPNPFAKSFESLPADEYRNSASILVTSLVNGVPCVLLGKRIRHEWYSDFGGKAEAKDGDLFVTASRETLEETGGKLHVAKAQLKQCPSHDLITENKEGSLHTHRLFINEQSYLSGQSLLQAVESSSYDKEYTQFEWLPIRDLLAAIEANSLIEQEGVKTLQVNYTCPETGEKRNLVLFPALFKMLQQIPVKENLQKRRDNLPLSLQRTRSHGAVDYTSYRTILKVERVYPDPKTEAQTYLEQTLKSAKLHQEIKKRNRKKVQTTESKSEMSQSIAHLQGVVGQFNEYDPNILVEAFFIANKDLSPEMTRMAEDANYHKKLIEILQNEALHPEHVVLYHATNSKIAFLSDMLSMLRSLMIMENCKSLRAFDDVFDSMEDVEAFLTKQCQNQRVNSRQELDNFHQDYQERGLSCNFSLFGNYMRNSSSTIRYFHENTASTYNEIEELKKFIEKILVRLNIESVTAQEFIDLYQKYEKNLGSSLYQIFIKKEHVNKYCYFSSTLGRYHAFTTPWKADIDAAHQHQLLPVIHYLKQDPQGYATNSELKNQDSLQARLYMHPRLMYDAEALTIETHHLYQQDSDLQKQLSVLTERMAAELVQKKQSLKSCYSGSIPKGRMSMTNIQRKHAYLMKDQRQSVCDFSFVKTFLPAAPKTDEADAGNLFSEPPNSSRSMKSSFGKS